MTRLSAAVFAIVISACDLNHFRRTPMHGPDSFAPALAIDLDRMTETVSGLRYQDVAPGTGSPAVPGDQVAVHYTGWLTNGKKFDSSHDREAPYSFQLGRGRVIAGWDEGVVGMRPGGRRKLLIPAKLGYGPQVVGPIPPNSVLVFEVELVSVR